MKPFGKLIKDARIAAGLTIADLVEKSDKVCNASNISRIENSCKPGKMPVRPKLEVVDGLAAALDIPQHIAREAANYAAVPDKLSGTMMSGTVFSGLFENYERLESPFREMAITLCSATLQSLFEIQIGSIGRGVLTEQNQTGFPRGKTVPMIYPAMESNEVPELVGQDNES